jgi:hypothetical protein
MFARVVNLAGNFVIADATEDTMKSMQHLFRQLARVSEEVLLDDYGTTASLNIDIPVVNVSLDNL